MGQQRTARTPVLDIAYLSFGDPSGPAVVLNHGFPYDVHSYRRAAEILAERGAWVIVPWLRGYGPTRFRDPSTPRSGQQAALGGDLLDLLDALAIERAVVGGYDWGGRAACVLAALHPERVAGLVTADGYNIHDIAALSRPAPPLDERRMWYVQYFQSDRGRAGLAANRRDLCRILWQDWSPTWAEAGELFEASAASLDNPDFVDVVIHSYRHRRGAAAGDPAYAADETRLAAQPAITVPTVSVHGADDGLGFSDPAQHRHHFTGPFEARVLPRVGHNAPQEAPEEFAAAVLALVTAEQHDRPSGGGELMGDRLWQGQDSNVELPLTERRVEAPRELPG